MKKYYIPVFLLLIASFSTYYYKQQQTTFLVQEAQAQISLEQKKEVLYKKLAVFFLKLDSKSFVEKKYIYDSIIKKIQGYKSQGTSKADSTQVLLGIIENEFNSKFTTWDKQEKERLSEIEKNKLSIKRHNSLILRFSKNGNHTSIIENKKEHIEKIESVFIFKGSTDLTQIDIQSICSKLQEINPKILIFIDQEGGWINRYVDFPNKQSVDKYFSSSELDMRTRAIFPKYSGYFPSLEKVGKTYDTFTTDKEKKYFLEKIADVRLQTLKDNGVNTYGLVLDLNRGNPVITNYARSMSKHVYKYKQLVDAFAKASVKTGVKIYFKHFPGHGAGNIDSHKGILDLSGMQGYLQDNIDLFSYALINTPNSGLMVGHMYLPDTLKKQFQTSIDSADFLLTDDLAMKGYKQATGKKKTGIFFSTDEIANSKKLIIVDTVNVTGIY